MENFTKEEKENIIQEYGDQEQSIIIFLALFNQIDKHFDKILQLEKFIPYNEKIKQIIKTESSIARFVKLHQYQLKYFGEVRNQITHGIKLNGHTYIIPTPYAIEQLQKYADAIKLPPRCKDIFGKKVFVADETETLGSLVQSLKNKKYSHIPVYGKNQKFLGLVIVEELFIWIVEKFEHKYQWENIQVKDSPLFSDNNHVIFVHEDKSIYEIDQFFTTRKRKTKKTGIVLITKHGKQDEDLLGIITPSDSAIVDSFVMH